VIYSNTKKKLTYSKTLVIQFLTSAQFGLFVLIQFINGMGSNLEKGYTEGVSLSSAYTIAQFYPVGSVPFRNKIHPKRARTLKGGLFLGGTSQHICDLLLLYSMLWRTVIQKTINSPKEDWKCNNKDKSNIFRKKENYSKT
jgi:hypothetical protein